MRRELACMHELQCRGPHTIVIRASWWLVVVGILLVVLCISSVSFARQTTAKISSLSGDVRVSMLGQNDTSATFNTVLSQGDAIQTLAGATAILTFSEGSRLELGEHTTIYLAVLERNPRTGAPASQIYLLWGKIRAELTPKYQKKGSMFRVETVNAMVTPSSQSNVEILYNWQTDTTIALAHTAPLEINNLLSGEKILLSAGNSGIVQGQTLEFRAGSILQTVQSTSSPNNRQIRQLLYTFNTTRRTQDLLRYLPLKTPQEVLPSPRETAQILGTPDISLSPTSTSGVSERTIRIGSAAIVGGGLLAIAILSGDDDTKAPSFTGTFVWEGFDPALDDSFQSTYTFHLTQEEDLINGEFIQTTSGCCTATSQSTVLGSLLGGNSANLFLTRTPASCDCDNGEDIEFEGGSFSIIVTLKDGNSVLSDGTFEYIRQ